MGTSLMGTVVMTLMAPVPNLLGRRLAEDGDPLDSDSAASSGVSRAGACRRATPLSYGVSRSTIR